MNITYIGQTLICSECGCAVIDTAIHTDWHERLEVTAAQAHKSGMFTNILGGPVL